MYTKENEMAQKKIPMDEERPVMQSQAMQTPDISPENMELLNRIEQIHQMEDKRDEMNAHNPDHTQYGISEGIPTQIIGREEVHKANEILQKYKEGKENLERRIIDNEQWWKMRHWEQINRRDDLFKDTQARGVKKPSSAWLQNSLTNKHADIMDNFPEPTVLPRARDDEETAKVLTEILPVVLEQNDFEETYSDTAWYKLKTGTGAYGIFWNSQKFNGMGDIDVKKVDLLNMFWEPGITDIQDSENVFFVSIVSNKKLKQAYPDVDLTVSSNPTIDVAKYIYDDSVDTTDMSAVVDWYYKVDLPVEPMPGVQSTKTILHYCKYCNGTVLYASENDEQYRERGYYDHGLYPFVFDTLFPEEGTPCGYGFIDIMKSAQEYIDRMEDAMLENTLISSRARFFMREDGGVNEEEFRDSENNLIHVAGNLGEDSIRQFNVSPLSSVYMNMLDNKINELKETSGNRDVNQGSTSSGVTAASAIAALQEAGSKGSRDMNKSSYRAFTLICNQIIELMRQFYSEPRMFRITGASSQKNDYATFDNSGLMPQPQGNDFGINLGDRMPIFDVNVVPQKKSAFTKMSENELAIQFYNLGFFAPNNADQSLACLDMMMFDGKDKITDRIKQNQTMFDTIQMLQQQVIMLSAQIDKDHGTNMVQQMVGEAQGTDAMINNVNANEKAVGIDQGSRGSQAEKATQNAQNVAQPK